MFVKGEQYGRQKDLRARFGGQPQGGISTPSEHPFVFIFTGKAGEQHGYEDDWRDDAVFLYSRQIRALHRQRSTKHSFVPKGEYCNRSKPSRDIAVRCTAARCMARTLHGIIKRGEPYRPVFEG